MPDLTINLAFPCYWIKQYMSIPAALYNQEDSCINWRKEEFYIRNIYFYCTPIVQASFTWLYNNLPYRIIQPIVKSYEKNIHKMH